MRSAFGIVAFCLCLALAGTSEAGEPDSSWTTIDTDVFGVPTCAPEIAVVCPAGDWGGITVTICLKDEYGTPIPGHDVFCNVEEHVTPEGYVCICPCDMNQTLFTDALGCVEFVFTHLGGCGAVVFRAEAGGLEIESDPVIIKSPDMVPGTTDPGRWCEVNLADFIKLATYYLTNDPCPDLNCSDIIDLADLIAFASHYIHYCPTP
jgi:hypothetical protein